ncbi:MAG TPA: hypothetical protein VIH63_13105, partial [Xanthobacteraceae bacterium]
MNRESASRQINGFESNNEARATPDEVPENDPREASSRRREKANENGTEPDVDSGDEALPASNAAPTPALPPPDPRLARLT